MHLVYPYFSISIPCFISSSENFFRRIDAYAVNHRCSFKL